MAEQVVLIGSLLIEISGRIDTAKRGNKKSQCWKTAEQQFLDAKRRWDTNFLNPRDYRLTLEGIGVQLGACRD